MTTRSYAVLLFARPQTDCPYVGTIFFISTQTCIVEPGTHRTNVGSTYVARCLEVTTVSQFSLILGLYLPLTQLQTSLTLHATYIRFLLVH